MDHKLKDGKYYIINRASGTKVGLTPFDPGFDGYAITKSPHHLEHHELPCVTFTVTNKKDDSYEIKIEGNFVIGKNGAVVAPPKDAEQLWKIVYREGNKAYTIEMQEKNEQVGWVLRGQDIQVKLAVLPSTKSNPPQYFGTDIWHFEKA